jgi:hypothetical protein
MARIKIKDLPRDMKISAEEMRRVRGGFTLAASSLTSPSVFPKVETTLDNKIEYEVDGKIVSDAINPYIDKWM